MINNTTCTVTVVENYTNTGSNEFGLWDYSYSFSKNEKDEIVSEKKSATITIYMKEYEELFEKFEKNIAVEKKQAEIIAKNKEGKASEEDIKWFNSTGVLAFKDHQKDAYDLYKQGKKDDAKDILIASTYLHEFVHDKNQRDGTTIETGTYTEKHANVRPIQIKFVKEMIQKRSK